MIDFDRDRLRQEVARRRYPERIAQELGITVADLFRSVDDHVSFDAAGAHITDHQERLKVARWLREYPPS